MKNKFKIKFFFSLLLFLFAAQYSVAQWVRSITFGTTYVYCFATTTIPDNGQIYQYAGTNLGPFISDNYGVSWTYFPQGLANINVTSIAPVGSALFLGSQEGAYLSTTAGASWSSISSYDKGLVYPINSMVVLGQNVFAGTGMGIYRSAISGNPDSYNWKKMNKGLADSAISCMLPVEVDYSHNVNLYVGTRRGVFFSPNFGTQWYPLTDGFPDGTIIYSLAARGTVGRIELYAGTSLGIYRSNDLGGHWYKPNDTLWYTVYAFAVYGNSIFAGTSYGVYRSTDGGRNWNSIGMTEENNCFIKSLAIFGNYLIAGTWKADIWRMDLRDIGVGIEKPSGKEPTEFALQQNYPNPFNPVTTIKYTVVETPYMASLPYVKLKVYDLIGREIATLVNDVKSPGIYSVQFDGSNLTSGIYIYKIQAGNFSESKKMILLK